MADPFLGEIRPFAFGFNPMYWLPCDGRLLPIQQYTALFSILGTNYGGNGISNFGLPNLQSSAPLGAGDAVTGTQYALGETGGEPMVQLSAMTTPAHAHTLLGASARYTADSNTPGPNMSLAPADGCQPYIPQGGGPALGAMDPNALTPFGVGTNGPHNNMMPSLAIMFCICINGIFPPRQ